MFDRPSRREFLIARRGSRWTRLGAMISAVLLSALAAPAQELPFDVSIELGEKAIAPDLVVAAAWDAQEVGALFLSVQKSAQLDTEPGTPCGIVDGDVKALLGETVGYLDLSTRASDVQQGVADIDGVAGACTVADIEGIADIEGVADIDGLFVRVDLVDLGGGIWSTTIPGRDLEWGASVTRDGWSATGEAIRVDGDLGPWFGPADGPELQAVIETPTGNQEVTYVVDDGWAVTEGDIVLGTAEELAKQTKAVEGRSRHKSHTLTTGDAWPGATVRYEYSQALRDDPSFARIADRVEAAAAAWNDARTNVRILPCPTAFGGAPPICAGTGVTPYLRITLGTGCRSRLGRVTGAYQRLWVHSGCGTGTLMHLFGHTLGLLHEHQRDDRDERLEVDFANARAGHGLARRGGEQVGDHDLRSIMHPSSFAWSTDRTTHKTLPTMLMRTRLTSYDGPLWRERLNSDRIPEQLAFGDFGRPGQPGNPDGVGDLLTGHGGDWEVVFGGGGNGWEPLNTATTLQPRVDQIQVADMDGRDGMDIVGHFVDINGHERWHVSYGGVSGWLPLARSGRGMDQVHVADFGQPATVRRDERADVFSVFGGHFQVSWNGSESWQVIAPACVPSNPAVCLSFDDLSFGDFGSAPIGAGASPGPADGITDVLARFDGHWHISFGGRSAWHRTRRSGISLGRILVGDIGREQLDANGDPSLFRVGDGQADLITTFGGQFWVSFGAQTRWIAVGPTRADISLVSVGDIDGNGTDEILSDGLFAWQHDGPSLGDIVGLRGLYP